MSNTCQWLLIGLVLGYAFNSGSGWGWVWGFGVASLVGALAIVALAMVWGIMDVYGSKK